MARKEATVIIQTQGRDYGKIFRLKEMPASQAESWGARAMLALAKSGVEVPENFLDLGMAGVAAMGIRALAGLPWDLAHPLLEEMFECVNIQPSPDRPGVVRYLIEDDIEEVFTRLRLREEILTLHTGFSIAGFISNLRTTRQEQEMEAAERLINPGQDTETSQPQLDGLFPNALQH